MKDLNKNADKIIKILSAGGYIEKKDIEEAENYAKQHHVGTIEYLIEKEIITKDLIGQAIAESYGVAYADLNSHQVGRERIVRIPEAIGKKYDVVLFDESESAVLVTTDDPEAKNLMTELKKVFKKKKISIAYSLSEDIQSALVGYRKKLDTRFTKIIQKHDKVAPEIIQEIMMDALAFRVSDIHFEPLDTEVLVRFRIDGVLQEAGRIPKEYYQNIINRIKVMAQLRTDEHYATQDGSIRFVTDEEKVDIRVSVAPTLLGEKIVLRLLGQYVNDFTLSELGLSEDHQKILEETSKKPFGMVLVSGPTGSGKTTTLYSILRLVNSMEINITTIEDPVEYRIPGVNHIQVNAQKDITFAKGLRSIVRQDPNVILVGEIRDKETSEIAVNAALTGHLLFSSFHANDAATVIPRLIEMGTEPFLLASTLELVIAQRLVRKVCENCKYSYTAGASEIRKIAPKATQYFKQKCRLYKGKSCEFCGNTGYKGRTAIFEIIPVDTEMKELLLKHPATQQIWDLAKKRGAKSMFEDGIEKVKQGVTTLEELIRVANPK